MNVTRNNLYIRYDDKKKKLVVYDAGSDLSRPLPEVLLLEFDLSVLQKMGWSEAGRWVGESILALMAGTREVFFGTTEQIREETKQARDDFYEQQIKLAEENDATAQFNLAMYYTRKGQKEGRVDYMETAEMWLKKAAENGHKGAIELLIESWERIKSELRTP
jgi:TPR repeat protein